MPDTVIRVEHLGKSYLIGHEPAQSARYLALRDVIARNAKSLVRKTRDMVAGRPIIQGDEIELFWALKDVSFEVKRGETLGIIGRNGAGKSTLLKILSRITEPTQGRVTLHGRVASLLEVGTGFHPELTGRENIFLNGAILGMNRAEIQRKFDEIVEFAGVEQFLDTPVKRFSSGMYVRLAFAVAAHLEPEILVVDEVLAVGDTVFQKKCLGKMGDVAKEGRTILFVSHNMAAIQNLCSRGIVLRGGNIEYVGSQLDAVKTYVKRQSVFNNSFSVRADRKGSGEVKIESIAFFDDSGREVDAAVSGQGIEIRLRFRKEGEERYLGTIASVIVKTQLETPVFLQHNRMTGDKFGPLPELGEFVLKIPRLALSPGTYQLGYSLMQDGICLDAISDAAEFLVTDGDFFGTGEVPPASHGICLVDGRWSLAKPIDDDDCLKVHQ
jgi:lipopolysaccharide transport system ATP-binding protein